MLIGKTLLFPKGTTQKALRRPVTLNPHDTDNGTDRAADPVEALLDRVLDGDKEAFHQVVRLHEAYVYRICLGITGNASDAEDAMQNTFLNAFLHLGQFRREARFRSWLTRIAINEALRGLRKKEGQQSTWITRTNPMKAGCPGRFSIGDQTRNKPCWRPSCAKLWRTQSYFFRHLIVSFLFSGIFASTRVTRWPKF